MEGLRQVPGYDKFIEEAMKKKKAMGRFQALGKMLPKLQAMREKMKLQDAQRKVKKLEFDQMMKEAEASAAQQEQQAARNSVV